jgi:hypothetical protein
MKPSKMLVPNNSAPAKGIHLCMDKLIADVKRVLEESDPTITVEEALPSAKPNGEAPDLDNEPLAT